MMTRHACAHIGRKRTAFLRLAPVLLLPLFACDALNPYACRTEARDLAMAGILVAPGADPSDTTTLPHGRAFFGAVEYRGAGAQQNLVWHVRVEGIDQDSVTAVHVHDAALATSAILYELPIRRFGDNRAIITLNWDGSEPYAGQTSYRSFYDRLLRGAIWIDVHTTRAPAGAARGELHIEQSTDWQDALCS